MAADEPAVRPPAGRSRGLSRPPALPALNQDALADRWESAEGRRRLTAILAGLLAGNTTGLPGFGGRVDLRGVTVPAEAESLNPGPVRLRGVDAGGSTLPRVRLRAAVLIDCRAEGASLAGWQTWDTTASGCSFRNADLSGALFGPGSRYLGCDFSGARLSGAHADATVFQDCVFDGAEISSMEFRGATLRSCRFNGLVEDTTFWAESLQRDPLSGRRRRPDGECVRDCDFSQATLRRVTFNGLSLRGVRLPEDSEQLLLPDLRCVLERVRGDLAGDQSGAGVQLRAFAEENLHRLPRSRSWGHLNLADLGDGCTEEEAEEKVAALRGAVAACAKAPRGGRLTRLLGGS